MVAWWCGGEGMWTGKVIFGGGGPAVREHVPYRGRSTGTSPGSIRQGYGWLRLREGREGCTWPVWRSCRSSSRRRPHAALRRRAVVDTCARGARRRRGRMQVGDAHLGPLGGLGASRPRAGGAWGRPQAGRAHRTPSNAPAARLGYRGHRYRFERSPGAQLGAGSPRPSRAVGPTTCRAARPRAAGRRHSWRSRRRSRRSRA